MRHIIQNDEDIHANYVPYPVQDSILYFPWDVRVKCLDDLNSFDEKKIANNFEEFSLKYFGKTLQDVFIKPYNEKVRAL